MFKTRVKTVWKLVDYLKEFRLLMFINLIIGFLYRLLPLVISFILSYIIGSAIQGSQLNLKFYSISLILIVIFRALLAYLDLILSHDIAYKILYKLRFLLYDNLEKILPAYDSELKSGELVSIAAEDINILEWFYAHTANVAIIVVFILLGSIGVLSKIHIYFSFIIIIFCAINIFIPIYFTSISQKDGDRIRASLGRLNNFITDYVQGLREIISFNAFKEFRFGLKEKLDDYNHAFKVDLKRQSKESGLSFITTVLSSISLLLLSRYLYKGGRLEIKWVPVVLTLSSGLFVNLTEFMSMTRQFGQIFSSADRVITLLEMEESVIDSGKEVLTGPIDSIEFKKVTFKYPKAEEVTLKNISFKIEAGEHFALAGPSGSGKTTIINLLQRFADPDSGEILINGKNIKEYSLKSLRENMAIVSQKSYIFNDSIMANLKLGNPLASDEEVKECVEIVGAREFIENLPNGYDTLVGERATKVSGGEAQRLSIVRAILKDSDILVFDEASSHLDTKSEAIFNKSMKKFKDKLLLTIAHRNSTISRAEKIIFINEGQIVDINSYEKLSENNLFREMIKEQESE